MIQEEWRTIRGEGFEDYQISNTGKVRSKRQSKVFYKPLKTFIDHQGYKYANFAVGKNGVKKKVHRLVMENFKPVPNMDKLEVDHIDYDRSNNQIDNLEWVTQKVNTYRRDQNPMSKNIRKVVGTKIDGTQTRNFESIKDASRYTGAPSPSIVQQIQGKMTHTHGWRFQYKEDRV